MKEGAFYRCLTGDIFIMKLQRLYSYVRKAIGDYQMIDEGDKIAIGISGGKDSLTLLYALGGLRRFYPKKYELVAITVNLGYDGFNLTEIRKLCEKLDVEYHVVDTQIKEMVTNGECSLCARLRKGAFNTRAKELGCTNTHFANPHGLTNENHYTTAHDLYCIAYEFAKHEELMEIANTTSYTVPTTNMSDERVLNTTNHLISTRTQTRYIYEYARGIKTGYTSAAQHCLVSTAQKNDMYLIAVVMKAPVLEGNIVTSFTDSKKVYEWVFANYELKKILKKGWMIFQIC